MAKPLAFVLVLAAGLLALFLTWGPDAPADAAGPRPAVNAPTGPDAPARIAPRVRTESEDDAPETARSAASPAPAADGVAAATEEAAPTVLVGRLLSEDGLPLEGAALQLDGWRANAERGRLFGLPDSWENVRGTSGPDGLYRLEFEAPRAFQFSLAADLEGRSGAHWRWSSLPQGETVELGDATLWPAGTVRARVVDSAGVPLTDPWQVYADASLPTRDEAQHAANTNRRKARVSSATRNAEGWILLEGLPPGRIQLRAYLRSANWIDGPRVLLEPGGTVDAEIVYDGPDNSTRITAVIFRPEGPATGIRDLDLRLFGSGGDSYRATWIEGSSQSLSFDDLPAGVYRMEVVDPRFRPWSQDAIERGSSVSVQLQGSAGLALEVADPDKGEVVDRYTVQAEWRAEDHSPRVFELLGASDPPPENGVFDGLEPGDYALLVRAEGRGEARVEVADLQSGERRSVRVELSPSAALVGTLRDHAGEPVANWDVKLSAHVPDEDPQETLVRLLNGNGPGHAVATTDAAGAFRFQGVAPGLHDLRTSDEHSMGTNARGIDVRAGETTRVELRLPPACFAAGRLLGPAQVDLAELGITLDPLEETLDVFGHARTFQSRFAGTPAPVASDGTFEAGPRPPGDYTLSLAYPDTVSGTSRTQGRRFPLGTVTLENGVTGGLEYDVGSLLPGAVEVSLSMRVGGAPASPAGLIGTQVRFRSLVEGEHSNVQAELDERGTVRIEAVEAGTYTLLFQGEDWIGVDTQRVVVEPAATARVEVVLDRSPGALRLQGVDGQPLANRDVRVFPDGGARPGFALVQSDHRTDGTGQLELALPQGSFRVALAGDRRRRWQRGPDVALAWPPPSAQALELTLEELPPYR